METFLQDLRYGARMLLKQPGFALIAALTLGLGIGANTAIFSVVNAVLLRPLPYAAPERLVALWESNRNNPAVRATVSYPNFSDWRARSRSFEQMAAYYTNGVALTGVPTPVSIRCAVASAEIFPLLGATPRLGRLFLPEEDEPGAAAGRAAIISQSFWQRQFHADPGTLGRTLTLNGKLFNVVGVMPTGFQFPIEAEPVEVWVTPAADHEKSSPNETTQAEQRGSHNLQVVGRLKPGVSLEQAQAELTLIAANLEEQYPETNTHAGVRLAPYHDDLVADFRSALWIILGAVGCVLLIACANVANLLLARSTVRQREIAVRAAVGASRGRIVRQLLTESLALSLIGGALGLLLAWWGTEALVRMVPQNVPRLTEISLDRWVFGFALLTSAATGIVFGLAPALQASKIDLSEAMKEGGRAASAGRSRLRSALVVAEIAVAIVVLTGAGLLLKSFRNLQHVDLGFDTRNVLTASVEIPDSRYPRPEQAAAFYRALMEKMRALPGVESASAVMPQPLSGDTFMITFDVEGRKIPKGEQPAAHFRAVARDYFGTMRIPLLTGRDFTARDDAASLPVMIVNEAFAKKHFPGENPIGKRVKPSVSLSGEPAWREIVGIVKNVKHRQALKRDYEAEYYIPHDQLPVGSMSLVLRTRMDPRSLAGALQREVNSLDKDVPVYRIKTMDQFLGMAVAQPKFNALLLSLFAALALALTAIGLYGVMAYSVAQRTQEIGVRLALGARRRDVIAMMLRQGLTLTALGLAIGLASALALMRLISSLLFGVTASDPWTFALIAALLSAVAMLACWLPARRAANVDPMTALRCE